VWSRQRAGLAVAVALALVVAGCAGSSFMRQPDEALVLGRTSYQEIRQRLGAPYREGTVVKNGKQLTTLTYAYATAGGTPAYDGVVATRTQGFYFFEDRLAGHEFVSTWKEDLTDFDGAKVTEIKNGSSTRAEVVRLIGAPGGKYAYPMIANSDERADVYLYAHVKGSAFNMKLYEKLLVVTYDQRGIVTNVDYKESGQK
jgi:hypothetical protein